MMFQLLLETKPVKYHFNKIDWHQPKIEDNQKTNRETNQLKP
jgi:hypothetical protein